LTDVARRIEAVRALVRAAGNHAFISRHVPNVTYLSGFSDVWDEEPGSLAVVTLEGTLIVTDSRFRESAGSAAAAGPFEVIVPEGEIWSATCKLLADKGVESVAVESSLPWNVVQRAQGLSAVAVLPVPGWVENLRAVKDEEEIERISAAQALTDSAFDHIVDFIAPGMSETQIALELEFHMRSRGSEGVAFPPIAASGPNSALPHARPGAREVRRGDFLKMDFGARIGGYCADMTRTVVVGSASAEQREMYDAVVSANRAGIEVARAGLTGAQIDSAARAVIEERGFAGRFGHGLGHGVGLEVHELPNVGPRGENVIRAGSVITIEPGVYVPGFGGVRVEDLVVVGEDGVRVLSHATKDLLEL